MDLNTWLSAGIAEVEARLRNAGPTCQLDRAGFSPPSLKETEGRYFVLRRAARLLEQGQPLNPLRAEADKARAFLAADAGLARNRVWAAYFAGVLKAVEDVSRQAGALRGRQPLQDGPADFHYSDLVEEYPSVVMQPSPARLSVASVVVREAISLRPASKCLDNASHTSRRRGVGQPETADA